MERAIVEENPTYEELKEWYGRSKMPLKKFFNTSGLLYKCNIGHTTQDDWPPETTPNLWTEVAEIGEYREIKDNMLPTEAFALGEIGWYKGKDNLWKSLIPANTYTPETYPSGWEKVTG